MSSSGPHTPGSAEASPAPAATSSATRDQRRSRRHRLVRAHSLSAKVYRKRDIEIGQILYPEPTAHLRPKTRADCKEGIRPCPFVSCHYHLYLDVNRRNGTIKLNFPDLEPHEMRESCALDVADRGGATLEEAGAILNITRERVRQIEELAADKPGVKEALAPFVEDEGRGGRRRIRLPVVMELDEDLVEHLEDLDDELLVEGDLTEEPLG